MAANLRYQLGFQCICWNTAEKVIHYSPWITSHTGISPPALMFLMKNKEAWRQSLEIALAQTECLPTLKLSTCYLARRPPSHSHPRLLEGAGKDRPANLRAPSPFGPNFRTGFFRTPTKAKGPREGPCLCLYLPVHVRAILPATLSRACCAADISYR